MEYQSIGNLDKAEQWAIFSVQGHSEVLPYRKDDPFGTRQDAIYTIGRNVLAEIYEANKKYKLAGELYFDVYKICIDLHNGIKNKYCFDEMYNLGDFLVKVGQYDVAEELLHSGLVISRNSSSYKRFEFTNSLKLLYLVTNRSEKPKFLSCFLSDI